MSAARGSMGHRRGSLMPPFSAPMAHTNSKVWVSPREAAHDRWIAVKENLSRVRFDRSPFVPQAFAEYVEHLATQAEDSAKEEKQRLADLEVLHTHAGPSLHPWIIPFEGKKFSDNRSPVLAQPSVWSPWYEYTEVRPESPWPSPEEFKEEGDERHTSGFGRFLPVPRVKGNPTVAYKQKAYVIQNPLDFVNPVLCREPPPKFAQEEEYIIADKLMTDLHIDFRAEPIYRETSILQNFVHPATQTQASVRVYLSTDVEASTFDDSPPSLEMEVDSATEDDAQTPVADGAEGTVATEDYVLEVYLASDQAKSQLATEEVKDLFQDHMFSAADKDAEPAKGTRLASPQEYAETTVEEDNETTVSESTLDNGMTMVKIDEVMDMVAAGLEA
ncbi:hypothetical protein MMC30_007880 [Trapelia coarctata]|nr:hypothetical protein [Trapelia coarctata]